MDDHIRAAEIQATRKAVSAELRARRAFRGLTQAQTATVAGLSKSAVERLEKGDRDMDIPQLVALARTLDFDEVEFMKSVHSQLSQQRGEDK
ncbi:helix-turn-helix transcriptional regulator [Rhodococcus sp. T2V]|uniref:helix-turn-helix domain-containing protein n=1 Tax=Rhodococcus sp. T2V TaxID=3034164 RepID=UPI0023E254F7|nr:helix-turn-helix transcriptional regulator [Rhodococcus sp. T2V]MDF3309804.1 helix-turn-helix transcriptional regulator [Rhodococcus sp. T2V]